jgi:hypothetical protein
MDLSKSKYMWNNIQALKIKNILTMYTNSIRSSIGLSKLQKHGMNALGIFLVKNSFRIGKADSTLFTRKMDKNLFVCQIHVNNIIFGSSNASFVKSLARV